MSYKIFLDHIGVATPNIESDNFFSLLGLKAGGEELVASENVNVSFFRTENGANIELLQPYPEGDSGPVGKFIEKRGPGIHHICFRVEGLVNLVTELRTKGVRFLSDTPKAGAHNCQVIFIHPKSTGGVLVELSEKSVNGSK